MIRPRLVSFDTPSPAPDSEDKVAKILPADAREALIAASKTEPFFRIRDIAKATRRIKAQYPQFFHKEQQTWQT